MRLVVPALAILGSLLMACAGTAQDGAASSDGADTSGGRAKLQSGHFDEVDLVVSGTKLTGEFHSSVGDPWHGGATCAFTFTGTITTKSNVDHASIQAVDGTDSTTGTIDATLTDGKLGLVIKTNDALNACARSSGALTDVHGIAESDFEKLETGISGYASVGAKQAFFYDAAGGNQLTSYVIQGDTIIETGAVQNGFVPAKFVNALATTTGWLRTQDLMSAAAAGTTTTTAPTDPTPAPAPAASPLLGQYQITDNDGITGGFEITSATDTQVGFNLDAVSTSHNHRTAEIDGASAPLSNNVVTYSDDDQSCTLSFQFAADGSSADVSQDGSCDAFGGFVDISGHYAKQ